MGKIEQIEPRVQFREQLTIAPDSFWRRPIMPAIRWGAIIAGVAVGMSMHLALVLFGMAVRLTDIGVDIDGAVGQSVLIWTGVGMFAASFVSGFVSARMSGLRRKTDGVLHGVVSWGVMTLLLAAFAGFAGGDSLGGIYISAGPNDARTTQTEDTSLTVLMRGMIGGDVSVADMQTLERYVRSGQREEATLLLSSIGMDPIRAATVVDQAMAFVRSSLAGSAQSAPSLFRTNEPPSVAAWALFGVVFFSLLLAMAGGVVGAIGSQRLVWSKTSASEVAGTDKQP